MKWTVSPKLVWGKPTSGWWVEYEHPFTRFTAPSEMDAMTLANILNAAEGNAWGKARDAALDVVYEREAAK